MDIGAARTFLEVLKTGSFVAAAANLNLTQTAVSARIRVLEEQLNRPVFIRNKAGVRLTPAGEQFQRFAVTLVQVWERARQQVALPAGRETVVTIGGEHSLWNPLLKKLLEWMHEECPDIAVRAHIDVGDRLMDQIQEGVLDIAVVYAPPRRPGVVSELLLDEKLIAVTTGPGDGDWRQGYVHVDWGPGFAASHHAAFPDLANPAVAVNFGPLAMEYILAAGGSGYFRKAAAEPHLRTGQLNLVRNAPQFSYSIYAVYSAKAEEEFQDRVKVGLRTIAADQR
ncbi:LysR family transcriptional regulator [Sphingosinicella humi]|uniref:LysR family transcriptional regulator n=1 Tax=Allosphingosinicella humi TaxID=2068657 RepID=A0A2U2J408_9SPHN|nr:LysR family transcriptional regulator [Sphingosinicella humi]PWG03052.1 LysR family transcriptional regulator [Sphingosinicella humi]